LETSWLIVIVPERKSVDQVAETRSAFEPDLIVTFTIGATPVTLIVGPRFPPSTLSPQKIEPEHT